MAFNSASTRVYAALSLSALALVGCGGSGSSGNSAKDQINSIVAAEGKDPSSLCDHMSNALLAHFGGASACKQKAASSPKDSSVHVSKLTVNGNAATAVVVDKSGTRNVAFVNESGSWKLAG